MSDEAPDKRVYRRVDVVIPMGFRPVDRSVVEQARRTESTPESGETDPLHAALTRIEQKVDALIRRQDRHDAAPPVYPLSVNLSGAGVRFGSEWPIEPGVCVELVLILPGDAPHRIHAFGEVVRQRKLARPTGGIYEIAVSFLILSPLDREHLIRYTFQVISR